MVFLHSSGWSVNWFSSPGWPQTRGNPASATQELGSKVCATMPTFKSVVLNLFLRQGLAIYNPGWLQLCHRLDWPWT